MGHLATAEQNRNLDLVFVLEKPNRFFYFELDIVFACFGAYADLFKLRLMRLVLMSTFALLIFEFAVVHDSAYGRI